MAQPPGLTTRATPGYACASISTKGAISPMTLIETAIERNPARAIEVCRRIAMINDFMNTIKNDAIEKYVPVSMPASVGSLGFDTPIWVGLGTGAAAGNWANCPIEQLRKFRSWLGSGSANGLAGILLGPRPFSGFKEFRARIWRECLLS
jgi:hypothetical protein